MDGQRGRQIRKLRSACGCREGLLAMLLTVGSYAGYAVLLDPAVHGTRHRVFIGLALGFAAAVVGKVTGILHARYRLRQLLVTADADGQRADARRHAESAGGA